MGQTRVIGLIAAAILLPGGLLAVLGYHALRQDRTLALQQARETLSANADSAAREVKRTLERWPDWQEAVSVRLPRGLLWALGPEPAPYLSPSAESAEIREDWAAAIRLYTAELTIARPEILLRLARTYKKSGDRRRAIETWRQIVSLPVSRSTLPAYLALIEEKQASTAEVYREFAKGAFPLGREQYHYYSERLRGQRSDEEERRLALTLAAEAWAANPNRNPSPGFRAFSDGARAVIIAEADLRKRLAAAAQTGVSDTVDLAASGAAPPPLSASRAIDGLPWQIVVTPRDPSALEHALERRQTLYFALLAFLAALLFGGVWLAARTVRREAEVARLKSDFVATVSHEFRSPLTGIRQLAELLDSGVVTGEERRREYFALILQESSRLTRLVENLLDFSRIEAGRKRFEREVIPPTGWLRELTTAMCTSRIEPAIPDELPPIQGDREALTCAVSNLIDNALKYSNGPVRLDAAASDGRLTISVSDRGPGIPEKDHARIFERFYRGSGEIASEVKGVGIGLSLVKHIVEAHGGSVALDSAPGRGSRFSIVLEVTA